MYGTDSEDMEYPGSAPSDEARDPADVATPERELAEARAKAEEYLLNWQRAQADFTNFRRRLEQDKAEFAKYAESDILLRLLPILDDLDRALRSVPEELRGNPWAQGMEGIARKFRAALEAAGLTPINALGQQFDPVMHDAMMHVPGPADRVISEYERGYKLKDRVLRPARVAVGNGEPGSEDNQG
jgi:molecular chaperone GrpE